MNIGIKECSKCENNIRCTECSYPHQIENMRRELDVLKLFQTPEKTATQMLFEQKVEIARAEHINRLKETNARLEFENSKLREELFWVKTLNGKNEVKHGYWHLLDNCANEGVYCSVCNKKVYKTDYANQKVKSNYCPNCGARMDGDKNDIRTSIK